MEGGRCIIAQHFIKHKDVCGVETTLGFSFHVVALLFVIVYHGAHNKERDTWQAGRGCSAQCAVIACRL